MKYIFCLKMNHNLVLLLWRWKMWGNNYLFIYYLFLVNLDLNMAWKVAWKVAWKMWILSEIVNPVPRFAIDLIPFVFSLLSSLFSSLEYSLPLSSIHSLLWSDVVWMTKWSDDVSKKRREEKNEWMKGSFVNVFMPSDGVQCCCCLSLLFSAKTLELLLKWVELWVESEEDKNRRRETRREEEDQIRRPRRDWNIH